MRHLAKEQWGGDVARLARIALAIVALVVIAPRECFARQTGIEQGGGCASCHGAGIGAAPTVTIVPDSANVAAGQRVTLTITIASPSVVAGGIYLPKPSVGAFTALAGTKLWPDGGVTHTAPARATGNQVIFQVQWTAPTTPTIGGVNIQLFALAANGDATNRNDSPTDAFLSFAYGCGAGTKFYFDNDGDGFGTLDFGYTVTCAQPANYATKAGDCRDNDPKVNPGAMEICDGKDNNCSGTIDEGLANTMLCEDKDGDGHGVMGGATHIGCSPDLKGFGVCDGDCKDDDPTVYPGAAESCNDKDDNCDGKIDENARPTCGVGWCKGYGEGCGVPCVPGKPLTESCNLFDDDCDGMIDNGTDLALCGEGSGCRSGRCVGIDADAGSGATTGSGPGTGSSGSATGAGSTGSGSASGSTTGSGGGNGPSNAGNDVGCAFDPRGRGGAWGLLVLFAALVYRRGRPRR